MTTAAADKRTALLDELDHLSERAAQTAGGFDQRRLDLSGRAVVLRFAGPRLARPLTLPFAHIEAPGGGDPALTIRAWDSESTSTPAPSVRWRADDYREHGVIRGFFGDRVYAIFQWGSGSLLVLDAERRNGYFWAANDEGLGMLDRGSPFRTLLGLWLWRCEPKRQLLHSAAVGRPDGAALLVGSGGAGKSSTALACLDSPLQLIGDDYCVVRHGDPAIVSSLYCSAKADPATLERLPPLKEMLVPGYLPETEKVILDIHTHAPSKLLRSAPLRSVIVPRISGRRTTTIEPCPRGAALAALAPSTMLQLPGTNATMMRGLREIVAAVPSYRLDVGTDPSLIPAAIEKAL